MGIWCCWSDRQAPRLRSDRRRRQPGPRVATAPEGDVQCAMCNVPRVSDSAEMASAEPGEEVVVAPLQDKAVVLAQLRGIAAAVHLGAIATEGAFDAILPAEHLRHPSRP